MTEIKEYALVSDAGTVVVPVHLIPESAGAVQHMGRFYTYQRVDFANGRVVFQEVRLANLDDPARIGFTENDFDLLARALGQYCKNLSDPEEVSHLFEVARKLEQLRRLG